MSNNCNLQIANPAELIERLKQNPDVLGILEYGSGVWPDGADTDLCVVVRERPEGLESVHFWIGCGPVDMNVRTLEELHKGGVAELPGFDDVLREGKVLYEKEPGLLTELTLSHSRPAAGTGGNKPAGTPTRPDHSFMRHGHAHVLHKLHHYKDSDPLLCDVLLAGATHWLLGGYVAARGLPYRGEKAALKVIRESDPELLGDLEELASAKLPIAERIDLLRRLTDKVLAPVGGPWQRNEVLFFAAPQDASRKTDRWHAFLASLLGVEGTCD